MRQARKRGRIYTIKSLKIRFYQKLLEKNLMTVNGNVCITTFTVGLSLLALFVLLLLLLFYLK